MTGFTQLLRRALLPGAAVSVLLPLALLPQSEPRNPTPARVIVVRQHGFEPSELRVPAGRALIAVYNRSGLRDLSLRLDRESGTRLKEVRLPRGKPAWYEILELSAGTYVLSEANMPKWTCRITVNPVEQ